jgi:hypothetical protein
MAKKTKGFIPGSRSEKFSKYVTKQLNKLPNDSKNIAPLFFKRATPDATNLFTGHRLRKGWTAALIVGAAAVSLGKSGVDYAQQGRNSMSKTDVGEMESLSYDTNMTGRKDLGATGDIVFGMHRGRKG